PSNVGALMDPPRGLRHGYVPGVWARLSDAPGRPGALLLGRLRRRRPPASHVTPVTVACVPRRPLLLLPGTDACGAAAPAALPLPAVRGAAAGMANQRLRHGIHV